MKNGLVGLKPVQTSDVLMSVKAELADAFLDIEHLKAEEFANRKSKPRDEWKPVEAFRFRKGNGTLTGKTEIQKTDGGKVSAVIPINVFAGSNLKPQLGYGKTATSSQTRSLGFSINPDLATVVSADTNIVNYEAEVEKNVRKQKSTKLGEGRDGPIYDAIVTAFKEGVQMQMINNGYHPKFVNNSLVIDTSFVVVRTFDGAASSTMLIPAVDLDELMPSLSASDKKTLVWSLRLELPMNADNPDPNELRRLIHGNANSDGSVILVEEPFSEEREKEIRKNTALRAQKRVKQLGAGNRVNADPDRERNTEAGSQPLRGVFTGGQPLEY